MALVLFAFNGNAQTIEDLRKSENPFKEKGEQFYNYLKETVESAQSKEFNLEEFIKKNHDDEFKCNINLTKEYVEKHRHFFQKMIMTNDLKTLISLENEILTNSDLKDKGGLLETISLLEWSTLYSNEINTKGRTCFTCWEACTDRCMRAKAQAVADSNWIEQSLFVLACYEEIPRWYASCSWDCARNYTSH